MDTCPEGVILLVGIGTWDKVLGGESNEWGLLYWGKWSDIRGGGIGFWRMCSIMGVRTSLVLARASGCSWVPCWVLALARPRDTW